VDLFAKSENGVQATWKFVFVVVLFATPLCAAKSETGWTNRFEAPPNCQNVPAAIVLGPNGNVYVTGSSYIIPGVSNFDFATIAYSREGALLWTNRYDGHNHNVDRATALAVGPEGNVYVTGYSTNSFSGYDFATIAYTSVGLPLWTNTYDGPGHRNDQASCIAVEPNGTVYVSGFATIMFPTNLDYVTIAYSSQGVGLWTNLFDGPTHGYDQARAIATGTNGTVFVTGWSEFDFATVAYSNEGLPLWTNRHDGPGHSYDSPYSICLGPEGNVYVAGAVSAGANGEDYTTIAYTSQGVPLWTNRYNGSGAGLDEAKSAAAGPNGNVYVTGWSYGTEIDSYDFATIAYTADGAGLWTNRYAGFGNQEPVALAVDGYGNVHVTGFEPAWDTSVRFVTIKYSAGGQAMQTNHMTSLGCEYAGQPVALAVDTVGNEYITGYTSGCYSRYDYLTLCYPSSKPTPIPLSAEKVANQLRLSWTNHEFLLQASSAMTTGFTNVQGASSPYTNSFDAGQKYFRLIAN